MQKLKIPIFSLLLSYEAEQIAILIEFLQIKWICFCFLSNLYTNSANLLSIRVQHLLPFLPQFCSTSSSDFNIDLVGFPPGCHPDSLFLFASSSISSASTIPSAIPVCCTVVHTPTSQVRKNRIMDKKKKCWAKKKLVQALPLTSGECNDNGNIKSIKCSVEPLNFCHAHRPRTTAYQSEKGGLHWWLKPG